MITVTSASLLLGLRDPHNHRVWEDFFARYQPLLISFCRRLGLSEHDAQDASQEALMAFTKAYRSGQYDQEKGRLRTWLSTITRHKVIDLQRQAAHQPPLLDSPEKTQLLNNLPGEPEMEEIWEAECHRALVIKSLEALREEVEPTTLRAFELVVLQEWSIERVAAELGISTNAVYKARRRLLSRMRALYRQLDADF